MGGCVHSCPRAWLPSPAEGSAGASVPSVGPGAVPAARSSHARGGPGSCTFKGSVMLRTGVWVVSGMVWGHSERNVTLETKGEGHPRDSVTRPHGTHFESQEPSSPSDTSRPSLRGWEAVSAAGRCVSGPGGFQRAAWKMTGVSRTLKASTFPRRDLQLAEPPGVWSGGGPAVNRSSGAAGRWHRGYESAPLRTEFPTAGPPGPPRGTTLPRGCGPEHWVASKAQPCPQEPGSGGGGRRATGKQAL